MFRVKRPFNSTLASISIWVFAGSVASASESDSFIWNGNLDFYFQSSPQGHSALSTTGPKVLEGRYFDRHSNEMTLNMAELSLKKKVGRTSFRIDMASGEMVDQLSGGSATSVTPTSPTNPSANESTRNITQATLSYQATERLSFTVGKFYTHIGLELTRAKENWHYSRSYLFNYGPFWHEGGSVTYAITPHKLNATVYLLNAWDGRVYQETNQSITTGLNLNYIPFAALTVNYNYIGGAEGSASTGRRDLHELNAVYNLSETISVALDTQYGSQAEVPGKGTVHWNGVAVYLKAKINNFYSISPRYEFFDDSDAGFAIAGGLSTPSAVEQKISAVTLTNLFDLGEGLEIRIEARLDQSTSDQFFRSKEGAPRNSQESYTAAALYSF